MNGFQIGINEGNGGIVKLAYPGVGTILEASPESAGLLDVAYPVKEFVPLRLATRYSKATITREGDGVTIRWSPLGPSRLKAPLPSGGAVGAEVTIRPADDKRSVILRCRIENQSTAHVPQVLFPDLHGMRAVDGPATTQLRFAGNYPVYPFTEDPIPPHSAQFYVGSGWKEYPPSTGVYGVNTLRWLDFGGYKGGLSVFQKAWGTGERPVVRTYRSQADPGDLRLMWDYKTGIKPGQTWYSDEVWLTPHRGGWAKGIEIFREYVKTKHPPRQLPARIRDGLGMQTIFMIQAPEHDPAYAAFKFKDIPRIAADAKGYGLNELNMWGWCEYFTLPFRVRTELGTAEDLLAAVKEAKAIGVNVSPFVSCWLQQNVNAKRYGGNPGSPAWAYHPDMVPMMDPYYLGAGYPIQFWSVFSIDPRNKTYQDDVLAAFKEWADRGVVSWSWDQVFGDAPGSGGLTDLLLKVHAMLRAKDPEAVFSGEQVAALGLEVDAGLLDYTWNWLDYVDAAPTTNLMRTPRINCNIEDSPRIVKAGFADNLYLNVFPRKPDQPNGTATISEKPALSAALKQVAGLRKQFLPYFVEGTLIGDSVLAEACPAFVRGYQKDDKLLVIVLNNQPQPMSFSITAALDLWLPGAVRYTVRQYDGAGKLVSTGEHDRAVWKVQTPQLPLLEFAFYEIAGQAN
jgi:hypothetical protein